MEEEFALFPTTFKRILCWLMLHEWKLRKDDAVECIYSDDVCILFISNWIDSQVFLRCTPTNQPSLSFNTFFWNTTFSYKCNTTRVITVNSLISAPLFLYILFRITHVCFNYFPFLLFSLLPNLSVFQFPQKKKITCFSKYLPNWTQEH